MAAFPSVVCVTLCVTEAGIVLVGRVFFEDKATRELRLDPEAEEIRAEPVENKAGAGSVLEGMVDVNPGPDKVPEPRVPSVEADFACEPDLVALSVSRADSEEELSDTLPPSPKFGVGNAETPDRLVDIASTADNEGMFVAIGDDPSPGMFSG